MHSGVVLPVVLVTFHLALIASAASSCACGSGIVPINVDVLVPLNASDPLAGFNSTRELKRRIRNTYGINTILCEPETNKFPGKIYIRSNNYQQT
jgi:hypothetical protein